MPYLGEKGSAQVLQLPTDVSVLKFVTEALERELHRDAHIPVIAQGEAEVGYGAPSGLALIIRFAPLKAVNERHHLTYGKAQSDIYTVCLLLDEMVIQGKNYGTVYKYDTWKFKFDWYDAMPKARNEIVSDGVTATGGKQLVSARTAREWIPDVDPDEEERRIKKETAEEGQTSIDTPVNGAAETNGTSPQLADPFANTDTSYWENLLNGGSGKVQF